jgi:hypothetical protein
MPTFVPSVCLPIMSFRRVPGFWSFIWYIVLFIFHQTLCSFQLTVQLFHFIVSFSNSENVPLSTLSNLFPVYFINMFPFRNFSVTFINL